MNIFVGLTNVIVMGSLLGHWVGKRSGSKTLRLVWLNVLFLGWSIGNGIIVTIRVTGEKTAASASGWSGFVPDAAVVEVIGFTLLMFATMTFVGHYFFGRSNRLFNEGC